MAADHENHGDERTTTSSANSLLKGMLVKESRALANHDIDRESDREQFRNPQCTTSSNACTIS